MDEEKINKNYKGTAPYLVVRELKKAVEYYHKVLGFSYPKLWGEPPTFAMPSRDGFIFMLKQAEEGVEIVPSRKQSGFWDAYVWVEDVDCLYLELKNNGAIIDYEPCIQKEYDMKEFAVRDLDDHVIAFGQILTTN
ncbi:VOC family protein [Rubritalea spongiae]|uniref:VOC family protein n=1 Tax=Rubritalea spongiae TaxID=430797 RepID=A0ABW5DY17_9BACT